MTRRRTRQGTVVAALAAVAAIGAPAVTTATAAPAAPAPATNRTHHAFPPGSVMRALTPTSAARAAGINKVGDAYMGWKDRHLAMTAKVRGGKLVLTPAKTPAPSGANGLAVPNSTSSSPVPGMDVSRWQGSVPWSSWYSHGKRFAYIKATEGTSYRSPTFSSQYTGSYNVGMIRGAYHFALPNASSGTYQADFFASHGGGWSADGRTLPGVLDFEYNPYGSACYNMSSSSLVSWVSAFVKEYHHRTGRDAMIYTAYNFWVPCMRDSSAFSTVNPLWVASYSTSTPKLFGRWGWYTMWQTGDSPLDLDVFNGSYSRLQAFAKG